MQPNNNFRYGGHTARGANYRPNPSGAAAMREARACAPESRIREEARAREEASRRHANETLAGQRPQRQPPTPAGRGSARPSNAANGRPSWQPSPAERERILKQYAAPPTPRVTQSTPRPIPAHIRGNNPAQQRDPPRQRVQKESGYQENEVERPYNPFRNFQSEMVDNGRVDASEAAPMRTKES